MKAEIVAPCPSWIICTVTDVGRVPEASLAQVPANKSVPMKQNVDNQSG